MASLKDIKRQIGAVKQTQKLTKAMNMVAAAKLRATQGRTESFRAYADEHHRLMDTLGQQSRGVEHALLQTNQEGRKIEILAFGSDRGLCGSFNTNIFQKLDRQIAEIRRSGLEVSLFLVGRKLREYYQRRQVAISHAMSGVMGHFDYLLAQEISETLTREFLAGNFREIRVLTTRFHGVAKQEVTLSPFLPLVHEAADLTGDEDHHHLGPGYGYLVEPDPATLFGRLIPRSLAIAVFQAMLESVTSENAARMQAMDNASKNCKEITENLTQVYNKLRQAAVTNELLDIVNGSEALAAA
ncbi:MAG: ATP synthase F1 subunit gamma [Candidatus Adiutrix sp.]|jgi:F-type H+-transporting ATPase subunit gamma|nr:ATP synthase F1 subunit gamma [Candidatus Adiutrix sp.]